MITLREMVGIAACGVLLSVGEAEALTLKGDHTYECSKGNSTDCVTDVSVGPGDPDHPSDAAYCHAAWGYSGLIVHRERKIKWRLKADPKDKATYAFDPDNGVSLDPNDHNDPSQDLDEHGHDGADRQSFKFHDRNKKSKMIHFTFVVSRNDGKTCTAGDPVIINMGD